MILIFSSCSPPMAPGSLEARRPCPQWQAGDVRREAPHAGALRFCARFFFKKRGTPAVVLSRDALRCRCRMEDSQ